MSDKAYERSQLAKAVLCKDFLHINSFTTDAENDKILNRIKKFQDKNQIEISEEQLYSENLIYNDRAK